MSKKRKDQGLLIESAGLIPRYYGKPRIPLSQEEKEKYDAEIITSYKNEVYSILANYIASAGYKRPKQRLNRIYPFFSEALGERHNSFEEKFSFLARIARKLQNFI